MNDKIDFYRNLDLSTISASLLFSNIELAMGLAQYNVEFGGHPLAQKWSILNLNRAKGSDGDMACLLSLNPVWAKTPAAQDPEVCRLGFNQVGMNLASNADKNGWGETPAADNPEIRKIRNGALGTLVDVRRGNKKVFEGEKHLKRDGFEIDF